MDRNFSKSHNLILSYSPPGLWFGDFIVTVGGDLGWGRVGVGSCLFFSFGMISYSLFMADLKLTV